MPVGGYSGALGESVKDYADMGRRDVIDAVLAVYQARETVVLVMSAI